MTSVGGREEANAWGGGTIKRAVKRKGSATRESDRFYLKRKGGLAPPHCAVRNYKDTRETHYETLSMIIKNTRMVANIVK